jgi:hypothetical protein
MTDSNEDDTEKTAGPRWTSDMASIMTDEGHTPGQQSWNKLHNT